MVCIIECLRNYCLFCTVHDIKQHSLLDWQFLCCFFLLTFTKSNSPPPSVDVVIYSVLLLVRGPPPWHAANKGGRIQKERGRAHIIYTGRNFKCAREEKCREETSRTSAINFIPNWFFGASLCFFVHLYSSLSASVTPFEKNLWHLSSSKTRTRQSTEQKICSKRYPSKSSRFGEILRSPPWNEMVLRTWTKRNSTAPQPFQSVFASLESSFHTLLNDASVAKNVASVEEWIWWLLQSRAGIRLCRETPTCRHL